jgi:hypothetical protein
MSFSTKSDLKTALAAWMKRSSISTQADDCITLAEAKLNRELGEVITDQTLTGVVSSNLIDISSYSVASPIGLFRIETSLAEVELTQKVAGTFPYSLSNGTPSWWASAGDDIAFDCPMVSAYSFRLHFRQRFSLAADGDTNWLLTNHPDVYLAACIVWGGLYVDDDGKTSKWAAMLDGGITSVRQYIADQHHAVLSVDPALSRIGGRSSFNFTTGQ